MQNSDHLPPDDAIVTTDGELLVDEAAQQVAARLREEAASLAEKALPQRSYAALMERLQERQHSGVRLPYAAIAWIMVIAISSGVGVYIWMQQRGAHLSQPDDGQKMANSLLPPERGTREATGFHAGTEQTPDELSPFVSSHEQGDSGNEPVISYQQRIEMLERALQRYQAALEAQQERIRQLEAELETLRGQAPPKNKE